MKAEVYWKQGLSFTGHADSGFEIPLGASSSLGGGNDGFRPLELMAISLAGCTAMDVISILAKKRQEIDQFTVEVQTTQSSDHPKVFTHIVILYHIQGRKVEESAVRRAIELSASNYCPAQAMLGKVVPMVLGYDILCNGKTISGNLEL